MIVRNYYVQKLSTNNFYKKSSFIFFFYLSPIYANEIKFLNCDVETAALKDHGDFTYYGKKLFVLELDIQNKTLVKTNFISLKDEKYFVKENFKIVSVTKNGLVAVSEEFKDKNIGFPDVTTITLKKSSSDNFLFESNAPVGFSLANNQQTPWEKYFFAILHGECN